jgi:hypothetical protein
MSIKMYCLALSITSLFFLVHQFNTNIFEKSLWHMRASYPYF